MNIGYRERCLDHDTGSRHPERAERLTTIREALTECHDVAYVGPGSVEVVQLFAVHDRDYVRSVRRFSERGGGNWESDVDTVGSPGTWDAALASAGITTWAAEEALDGASGAQTPFAIGRPPGHHAVEDDAMGFCFFNNVAVAAQSVLNNGSADRVAIIDWDVHHGNGTQDIFYDQGDVFYVSFHQEGIYPGSGDITDTGAGPGEGRTMNIPFPAGTTSSAYLHAIKTLVEPVLTDYGPDVILVSAGFDAHENDRISQIRISTEGFARLAARVRELGETTDAGIAFTLEGGYDLDTLGGCVRKVNEVFGGYEPAASHSAINEEALDVIEAVRNQGF